MLKARYDKLPAVCGIVLGQGLFILFVLLEYFLIETGISACGVIVDSCLRVVFGAIALLLMHKIDHERIVSSFSARIPKSTWLYCIPFLLYLVLELMYLPLSERLTTAYLSYFLLACLNQLATGIWEETASKGLVMSGMLVKWERTVKGRIGMVLITGVLFGSLHFLNVLFNNDLETSIWNAIYSSAFGIFMAAIYLYAKNIPLCMVLHAVWDIIIRIPGNFCEPIPEGPIITFICVFQDILLLGILPVVSIIICAMYDRTNEKDR